MSTDRITEQTMADTPAHQPHGPSDNPNKTADALREVSIAIRHHQKQPHPSRNEVMMGRDSFNSCDLEIQNASPHQHCSPSKNANKTTDTLRDEPVSKGGLIHPSPTLKETVVVPNSMSCQDNITTSPDSCQASTNVNGDDNGDAQDRVSLFSLLIVASSIFCCV